MMAAAIIPLIGIIGGGLDMSRIYLVKTRLQQACDAGALAARRSMTTQNLQTADRTKGQNFFSANLQNGAYGSQNVLLVLTNATDSAGNSTGAVHGHATAEVPLTLMRVFWPNGTMAMATDCEAQLNITNNDVMFVLDTTGSMACLTSDSSSTCSSYAGSSVATFNGRAGTTEKSNSRIDGLRAAVENFARTLSNATPTTARLRIGFIPYAESVNMQAALNGSTGLLNTTQTITPVSNPWLQTATYMTRRANFTTANTDTTTETYAVAISAADCLSYGSNSAFSGFTPTPPAAGVTYSAKTWGGSATISGSGTKTCVRNRNLADYKFTSWDYGNYSLDVSDYVAGSTVPVMTGSLTTASTARTLNRGTYDLIQLADMQNNAGTAWNMPAITNTSWEGCIIERGLSDDIDTSPTTSNANSQWAPAWPQVTWANSGTGVMAQSSYSALMYACPKTAQRLQTITSSNLIKVGNYVNILNGVQIVTPAPYPDFLALGYTYHDIGMVWGARLMSPNGIFSADHGAAPNGRPVNRHIIFMTDGDMETSSTAYSAYGVESSGDTAHNNRFLAACQAAKDRGISVWVVSFAQALTTELRTCANTGQAFQAANSADLNQMFQTIAQRIAELRLTQ